MKTLSIGLFGMLACATMINADGFSDSDRELIEAEDLFLPEQESSLLGADDSTAPEGWRQSPVPPSPSEPIPRKDFPFPPGQEGSLPEAESPTVPAESPVPPPPSGPIRPRADDSTDYDSSDSDSPQASRKLGKKYS